MQKQIERTAPRTSIGRPIHTWHGIWFQLERYDHFEIECCGIDCVATYVEECPTAPITHEEAARIIAEVMSNPREPYHAELCQQVDDDWHNYAEQIRNEPREY
jgi:hypothetical protein